MRTPGGREPRVEKCALTHTVSSCSLGQKSNLPSGTRIHFHNTHISPLYKKPSAYVQRTRLAVSLAFNTHRCRNSLSFTNKITLPYIHNQITMATTLEQVSPNRHIHLKYTCNFITYTQHE